MVELITLGVLLTPPVGSVVILYSYFRYRRKKGKKIGFLKSQLLSIPFAFLSSQWMTFVINNTGLFGIPAGDVAFLARFKETVERLPFLEVVPIEYRLLLVLALLIFLALLPGP